jgi:hypothetical protein
VDFMDWGKWSHCATTTAQEMRDRPLGAGLQEQAPNHLKLHWLRAFVVSVEEKGMATTVSDMVQGDECK